MSLLGRIGVYFASCLFACAAFSSVAAGNDQDAGPECTIADAQSGKIYGVQLYTLRAEMERNFEESLCHVAQIGYQEVELAGLFGRDAHAVRATLQRYGLKPVASHADWRQLRDDPQSAIRDAKALGVKYLVLAWLPPEERQSLAQWHWWARQLNEVGALAASDRIGLLYHAHDFEYRAIDGTRPIDFLQEQLDPRFVNFEMDVYWTVKGGGDPIALLRQFPGRFPLAHVKDMQKDNSGMADVGDGRIDFAAIFAAAGTRDFLHKFVERDEATEPFETLRRSLKHLISIEREPKK